MAAKPYRWQNITFKRQALSKGWMRQRVWLARIAIGYMAAWTWRARSARRQAEVGHANQRDIVQARSRRRAREEAGHLARSFSDADDRHGDDAERLDAAVKGVKVK